MSPTPQMPARADRPAVAAAIASMVPVDAPAPDRATLERWGRAALARCGQGEAHLGYAMVLASNAWWTPRFAAVPQARRLLLLPHCLRASTACAAPSDAAGLHCRGCGGCDIGGLGAAAEALGWHVVVAEGVSGVLDELVHQGRDAILGVACLDSLDRSFARVRDLGIPHLALPLDGDGCTDTSVDGAALRALIDLESPGGERTWHSWLPLLRAAGGLCAPAELARLLDPPTDPVATAALDWLREGGKRLRAFIVLAAYAVGAHGATALRPDAAVEIPDRVRRLALAIEAMHKASLVHDDIQDDEAVRYGRPTLHRALGTAAAINVGDWLIGLGYRLVGRDGELAMVGELAAAHLALCRGQGAELRLRQAGGTATALEVLAIAGDKTAPAFAVALTTGLRAAGASFDGAAVERLARCLGEAFQVRDDLDDDGGDIRAGQPTILRALALERVGAEALADASRVAAIYRECGARERAERLAERLRQRALEAAAGLGGPELAELGGFLVRTILAPREA